MQFGRGFYFNLWFILIYFLILIPFILSRIILLILKKEIINKILKYINYVSKIAGFIVIVYIFSLSYIRKILDIETIFIIKSIISIIIFYFLLYFMINFVIKYLNLEKDISKSIFWNAFTRFITLALILSVLYVISWDTSGIIIIPLLAYFIQIVFASLITIYQKK